MSAFEIGLFINNLPIKTGRDGAWMRGEKNEKIGYSAGSGSFIGTKFCKNREDGKKQRVCQSDRQTRSIPIKDRQACVPGSKLIPKLLFRRG